MITFDTDSRGEAANDADQQIDTEPPARGHFGCVTPDVGGLLYDFLVGDLERDKAEVFEEHQVLCLHCQTELAIFKAIFIEWRKNPDQYFGARRVE